MSVQAITWALRSAPVDDPAAAFVLVALADAAGDDGTGAWPARATIAERTRYSESTVKRCLRVLERGGLIRRGDQRRVEHLSADRRPVVWDLALERRRESAYERGASATPRDGSHGTLAGGRIDPPTTERGATSNPRGGSHRPDRGVTVTPKPSLNRPWNRPAAADVDDGQDDAARVIIAAGLPASWHGDVSDALGRGCASATIVDAVTTPITGDGRNPTAIRRQRLRDLTPATTRAPSATPTPPPVRSFCRKHGQPPPCPICPKEASTPLAVGTAS